MIDQNSQFQAILTAIGEAKQANADALGIPWTFAQMGVGDANDTDPFPDRLQTKLINERRRAPLNQLKPDPNNPGVIIAEQVIPENVGGFWIREIGLYDQDGDLVAVANCAPTFKPLLAQGSGRTQIIRMNLIVSSTANIVLKIDPSVVLATRQYVDESFEAILPGNKAPGTYRQVTINNYGIVLSGTNPTTLAGYGITDALSRTGTAAAAAKLETARTFTFTGAATGSGTFDGSAAVSIGLTLADAGVTPGAFPKVVINAKGLVVGSQLLLASDIPNLSWNKITSGTPTTLGGYGITDALSKTGTAAAATKLETPRTFTFTGAATGSGTFDGSAAVSIGLTLADAGVTPGAFPKVIINSKGLVVGSQLLLASDIPNLSWSKITSDRPTSLDGYGITDKINGVGVIGAVSKLVGSASGNSGIATFGADEILLEDLGGNYLTRRGVAIQVSVGAAGLGGMDTGASASNTWYSVWVISNGAAVFGLLSLSEYEPVMPAGYTYKARIGWIRTDGTANKYPLGFTQVGRRVQYRIAAGTNVPQFAKLINGSTSNVLTAVSVAASLPPTAGVVKVLFGNSVGAVNNVYVAPSAAASIMDNASAGGVTYTNNGTALVMSADIILESRNLYFSSGAAQSFLSVIGWEDNL